MEGEGRGNGDEEREGEREKGRQWEVKSKEVIGRVVICDCLSASLSMLCQHH